MHNNRASELNGKAADGPAKDVAAIAPFVARSVLGLVEDRGFSPETLCRGLGFAFENLQETDFLLSHNQIRRLILRAQRLLDDPAPGLAAGIRQTPISWGVVGLAMMTCETLGEAIGYGLAYQGSAGAMVDYLMTAHGDEIAIDVTPRRHDLRIDDFLIDEACAGSLAIARHLVGNQFKLLRVDLAREPVRNSVSSSTDLARAYRAFYGCPVHFNTGVNRMSFPSRWLTTRLPTYDRAASGFVQRQLNAVLKDPIGRHDLVESVASKFRVGAAGAVRQGDFAQSVNMSERTLRRKLRAKDTSFRQLADENRFEVARDRLAHSSETVEAIARAIGYSDARAFRRAFKRWSGMQPLAFRVSQQAAPGGLAADVASPAHPEID